MAQYPGIVATNPATKAQPPKERSLTPTQTATHGPIRRNKGRLSQEPGTDARWLRHKRPVVAQSVRADAVDGGQSIERVVDLVVVLAMPHRRRGAMHFADGCGGFYATQCGTATTPYERRP